MTETEATKTGTQKPESLGLIWHIALKDLKLEFRSRVILNQLLPFCGLILVIFGFAFETDSNALKSFAPGLFWSAVLLAVLFVVNRSFTAEISGGAIEGLKMSGTHPILIFVGKTLSQFLIVAVLQVFLGLGVVFLYGAEIQNPGLLVAAAVLGALGISSAGSLYGLLAANSNMRETILPLLLLPVLIPLFLASVRTFDDALGAAAVNGWAWLGILGALSFVYAVLGALAFGVILEETDSL